ncbi:Ig-like domain-containing protein [Peribacillus psychrosaccharolyticus]|nr:Ig-like domain-containing protein [Peribacillus psychrosaccharolyticus]MEC2056102.1 Ig-like domain-containing protein [Peribacillus psychrosaccharolyticus]MED3745543.1 Ig-like domain-containing protein [Peribacillus psychrosaccharolyticus]
MKKVVGIGLALSLFTFSVQGIVYAKSEVSPNKVELKQMFESNIPDEKLLTSFDFKGIIKTNENKHLGKQRANQSKTDDDTRYEEEPNDHFESANIHDMKYYISGTIDYDDIDLFKVMVPKSGLYLLAGTTADGNLLDLGMGIFDENENILKPVDGQNNGKTKGLGYYLNRGTYYLGVIDLSDYGLGEDYLLQFSPLDNSTDTTAPNRPKVNQIDDNDTRVTGTAESNSHIWIQAEDDWIGNITTDSKGKFSIKIPRQKAGTHIAVCAIDEAGNQGEFSVQWVIDKTAPSTLTVEKITVKTSYVTGKTEAKAKVQVKSGSTSLGTATADSKGNYKVRIAKQTKGKKITVIARDSAKNAKIIYTTVK